VLQAVAEAHANELGQASVFGVQACALSQALVVKDAPVQLGFPHDVPAAG